MTPKTWVRVVLWAALVGAVVAVALILAADHWLPGSVEIAPGTPSPLSISIDGAVGSPGVYSLPAGSRLIDLLALAGGLSSNADLSVINMAGRVGDGEHITIPSMGQGPVGENLASPIADGSEHLINVNTANVAELDQLPGVGPVIAQRIIDFREFYGPFDSIDQLAEVEGISPEMIRNFRDKVTVGG